MPLDPIIGSVLSAHLLGELSLEQMADETLRVCCECGCPAEFGSPTCEKPECKASLAAWIDMDERTEPVCQHEDDGGPFFAQCRKCGAVLDDYAGGD